jgi:ribonuclease P protein component
MTDRHPEGWPRDRRLRRGSEFALVKSLGTAWRGRHCLVVALERPGEPTRVGFVASRKGVGDAVHRNRARRRLREIVRRALAHGARPERWLMFVAFRSATTAPHAELVGDVESLLGRAGALAAPPVAR